MPIGIYELVLRRIWYFEAGSLRNMVELLEKLVGLSRPDLLYSDSAEILARIAGV